MKERTKLFTRLWDLPYGRTTPYHLYDACKNSTEIVQKFQIQRKISVHNGCVNSIAWNETGSYLLSGSDDLHLSVINGSDYSIRAYIRTGHRSNIFSAKFLPSSGDSHVVSSSGDGFIIYSDLERPETSMENKFGCHRGTAYEIMTVPNDPNTFLSCGEDRTVRWFDIRTKTSCNAEDCKDDVLIFCRSPVTSIAVNPLIPYQLAVGCADSSVQIFDRRMLSTQATAGCLSNGFRALMAYFTVPDFPQSRRITSLCYSGDGQEMLVSYSSDYIYLFDIKDDMGRKPKVLCADGAPFTRSRPVMKRLRVRGDWSDTGPNSRPETHAGERLTTSSPNNLVRRMTDILTRMLFSANQNRTSPPASASSSESSPRASSQSEEGDAEAASEATNDTTERSVRSPLARRLALLARSSELISEESSSQASDSNTNASQSVPVNNSTQTEAASESACCTNCGVVEQENAESQSSDASNKPGASGQQQICDSGTDATDSSSNTDEQFEPKPSISSHLATVQESENKIYLSETSLLESENVASTSSVLEKKSETASGVEIPATSESAAEASSQDVAAKVTTESIDTSVESETDVAVQSIEPGGNIPTVSELQSPRSPSPETASDSVHEVELMMEVDSWDSDSDEGSALPHSSQSNRGSRRRGRASSGDEMETDEKRQVRKEKPPKNVRRPKVKQVYSGHRNARTMIKESNFWGDNFVMSGSDCGHIFIWDRHTTDLVMIMEADHHVVNCLQPHPFDPILASSGIDYDIKIWAPLREEPFFDSEKANEIMQRNEIMLEVTKDTITVPASFMFNMFNTLNSLRTGNSHLNRWRANRAARAARNQEASNREQDASNR